MYMLLSPAKRLDETTPLPDFATATEPVLLDEAGKLMRTTRNLSQKRIRELMHLSQALGKLNADRYKALSTVNTRENSRPAALTFAGDVYVGMDAQSMDAEDFGYASVHLGILSGLYGLLRPLDAVQPHRLEMGTPLPTRRGRNLYEFWGDRITRELNRRVALTESRTVVNLASTEYFKSVRRDTLKGAVVTPVFKEEKDGRSRVISFMAKRARGRMARFAVDGRVTDPSRLKAFDWDGYVFQPRESDETSWVFSRPQPPPPGS